MRALVYGAARDLPRTLPSTGDPSALMSAALRMSTSSVRGSALRASRAFSARVIFALGPAAGNRPCEAARSGFRVFGRVWEA